MVEVKIATKLTTALFTAGGDKPWFWSITCKVPNEPAGRGNAATREEAMQAFKARWLVVSAKGTAEVTVA